MKIQMNNLWASDIETDGLLDTVSKFHCAWLANVGTGEYTGYRPHQLAEYCTKLQEIAESGGHIAFHNGIDYDIPALKILNNLEIPQSAILDTVVLSRLIYSNMKDLDMPLMRAGKLEGKYFGNHSLKAWGYRMGILKGEYGQQEDAWDVFSEEMYIYCKQDVLVTVALLERLLKNTWYFPEGDTLSESVLLEHEAAWLMAKQTENGFPFDTKSAEMLYIEVAAQREDIRQELNRTFGTWYQAKGGTTPFRHPRTGKDLPKYPRVKYPKAGEMFTKSGSIAKTLYFKDAPFTPVSHIEFNAGSRDHILKVLKDCGWVPTEFTDAGNAVVDDDTLALVVEHKAVAEEFIPKVELIREYLVITKLIGQLSEGKNAWLRHDKDGYIHGRVNPNGAVTGRATHSFPNMAQIPSIRKFKGMECRSLFGAEHHKDYATKKPWIQVGVDASGLELRCLGHFMARFDDGEYIDTILNGDIHSKNQEAAGLPTRDNAKTFIYGFLYGAGAEKIGEIVGKFGEEGKQAGKELTNRFLEQTPAIASLRELITLSLIEEAKWVGGQQQIKWKRKWIKGLDGRQIHVRSPHSALNSLLQSAGALICKKWVVEWDKGMQEAGYRHGWDGDYAFMAWVHKIHCAR